MINVLQAVILTENEKMILTPTYHTFRMYVPFQDAAYIPVNYDAGNYQVGNITLPRIDAIAAKGKDGNIYVAITNIDAGKQASFDLSFNGQEIINVAGETLYASSVDAINTFENPNNVSPKEIKASVSGNKVALTVEPQSVTVLSISIK